MTVSAATKTKEVYNGADGALTLTAVVDGGVVATETNKKIFFSADATHLNGGGSTALSYDGLSGAVSLQFLAGGGVLTEVAATHKVFVSSDFKNLVGGGNTKQGYDGGSGAVTLTPLNHIAANGQTTVTAANGLKTIDEIEGTGAAVKKGDKLTVNYSGFLDDGTKFDSSIKTAGTQPFVFTIGKTPAAVIQGWELGLLGLKVGGLRKLIIPSALGYGAAGFGTSIPPNANLIFEVELLSVVPSSVGG